MVEKAPKGFKDCDISPSAVIESDDIEFGSGVTIEAGVRISAKKIRIGAGSTIERGTSICALSGKMLEFTLGDQCLIGFDNQIMAPSFRMGDYCQLHNNCLSSGYKPLQMGHNCWVGQGSILNCTEHLTIGNNVRIGTNSQLWTHVASGELLEGCTMLGFKPLTLEDNVWIVGGAVISPGLVLAKNSIIMVGAVLTKSTQEFHTYAGVPAKDVTDKLNFWEKPSPDEKFKMIKNFIIEFIEANPEYSDQVHAITKPGKDLKDFEGHLLFTIDFDDWGLAKKYNVSVFDISSKRYLKNGHRVEIDWIRWSMGYRARFVPFE